jgi:hypothetical protein
VTLTDPSDVPDLWNAQDPKVKLLAMQHEDRELHTWNNHMVSKLARDMGCTIWVLCATAGCFKQEYDSEKDKLQLELDEKLIRRSWKNNLWPVLLSVQFQRLRIAVDASIGRRQKSMLGASDKIILKQIHKAPFPALT